MKHKILPLALLCGAFAMVFNSCTEDLNVKDMDSKVDVKMSLALPVGDVNITLGDLLKTGNVSRFIQVDPENDNVLFYKDTFEIRRSYHHVDLKNYVGNRSAHFGVANQIPASALALGYFPGDGVTPMTFNLDINLKFDGINKVFDNERLDSIQVRKAKFISTIHMSDIGIDWDEVKDIRINLDPAAFSRKGGNSFSLPLSGSNFDTEIPIDIESFSMNLVKDHSIPAANSNVLDSAKLSLTITCVPRNGHNAPVAYSSAIDYTLRLELMEYDAVFGRFEPGNQMFGEEVVDINKEWDGWKDLSALNVKLAEPRIDLYITHRLGVPLQFYGEYLYAQSAGSEEKRYAKFYGKNDKSVTLPDFVRHNAPLNDSVVTRNPIRFDNTDENGRIDELFAIRPDFLGYKFAITPDWTNLQLQGFTNARLTNDTIIDMKAIATVPFIFNPGVDIAYIDTITDVSISKLSLDSLVEAARNGTNGIINNIDAKNLKLAIISENHIPFDVTGEFTFLNSDNKPIDQLIVTENNTLVFKGPKEVDKFGDVAVPERSVNLLTLDQDNFKLLSQAKSVKVKASLGNNTAKVRLTSDSYIKLHIGVAVDNGTLTLDLQKLLDSEKDKEKENK